MKVGEAPEELIVRVTDIGLSEVCRSSDPAKIDYLQFLAEEIITGGYISPMADIWSLGAILYFMVSQNNVKIYEKGTGEDKKMSFNQSFID